MSLILKRRLVKLSVSSTKQGHQTVVATNADLPTSTPVRANDLILLSRAQTVPLTAPTPNKNQTLLRLTIRLISQ